MTTKPRISVEGPTRGILKSASNIVISYSLPSRSKVENLQMDLELIHHYLQDADTQKEKTEVPTLVNQLRKLANDAEDTIDTYIFKLQSNGGQPGSGSSLISRPAHALYGLHSTHKVAKHIQEIQKRLKKVTNKLETHGVRIIAKRGEGSSRSKRQRTYSYDDDNDGDCVIGFEKDIQNLAELLVGDDEGKSQLVQIMCIVGMGGCGKTTLAKKLYNHPYSTKRLDCMAWVFISQEWDTKHILSEILRNVNSGSSKDMDWSMLSVEGLVSELRNVLTDKSYLVVLDDVWDSEALEEVLPALPCGGSNVRGNIVITTRNRKIIQLQKYQQYMHIHEPQPLSEDQGWQLLSKIALSNVPNNDEKSFESLGKEMLQKCDGLPLAIRALAGILSGKQNNIGHWQSVNKAVRLRVMEDTSTNAYNRVKYLLALSYDNLPYHLKPCFLYLGLFPEDCEIPAGMLTRMWIAEGLAPPNQEMSPEDVAMQYLEELSQRFMIQVAKSNYKGLIKAIRVHDLLRELCVQKARGQCFLDILTQSHQDHKAYTPSFATQPRRIALHSSTSLPNKATHLRSLVLLTDSNVRRNAYISKHQVELEIVQQNFKLLRLLTLCGIKTDTGTLPTKIGCLIHLRYLEIRATNITELPTSIGNLRNLLTLDYRNVDCENGVSIKIPNVLWKLVLLRHLFLPVDHPWSVDDLELTPLKNLRTLWGLKQQSHSTTNWLSREAVELSTSLKKLKISVTRMEDVEAVLNCPSLLSDGLHTFHCELSDDAILCDARPLSSLQQLYKLVLVGEIRMELSNLLPEKLGKLELKDSMLEHDVDLVKVIGALAHLKLLKLTNAYLGTTMDCTRGSFPQLEELYLESLPNLDKWTIEEGALPCLRKLEIVSCWKLQGVRQGLDFITTLKQFEFFEMPKLFKETSIQCGWSQKRFGLPYNCREIIKQSDSPLNLSSTTNICKQLMDGIFLNDRKQKYWVKEHDGSYKNCFMVYAIDLDTRWYKNCHGYDFTTKNPDIILGDHPWIWDEESEREGLIIKVAKLAPDVDFVILKGRFKYDNLSLEVRYEVAFEIKLEETGSGLEMQTECRLTLPDGSIRKREEWLDEKPIKEWTRVVIGEFETSLENSGEIEFSMSCEWPGLIVKGVVIQPKD